MESSISLFSLALLFSYIGLCSIGGGLVGISIMQQELIPRNLISMEEFYSMIAISESTPGPIGVNMATFIGNRLYGVVGGCVTTAALVFPSFVIIIIIALFARSIKDKPMVKNAFYGIRAASTGMIAVACYSVLSITIFSISDAFTKNWYSIIHVKQTIFFFLALGILRFIKKIHPLFIIVLGALFGYLFL